MMTEHTNKRKARNHPTLVSLAMRGGDSPEKGLVFRPEPPGDQGRLYMPIVEIDVDVKSSEMERLFEGLGGGALSEDEVRAVLEEAKSEYGVVCPQGLEAKLLGACNPGGDLDQFSEIVVSHHLEHMA